jgi:hypothetical protein
MVIRVSSGQLVKQRKQTWKNGVGFTTNYLNIRIKIASLNEADAFCIASRFSTFLDGSG